jgi:hypothetical protein
LDRKNVVSSKNRVIVHRIAGKTLFMYLILVFSITEGIDWYVMVFIYGKSFMADTGVNGDGGRMQKPEFSSQ